LEFYWVYQMVCLFIQHFYIFLLFLATLNILLHGIK
jgi:hypothetical protein